MTRYRYRRGMTTEQKAGLAFAAALGLAVLTHQPAHAAGRHHHDAAGMAVPSHWSSNEQLANKMAARGYGWKGQQRICLDSLWARESAGTWSPTVTNPTSGAYGIPQSLPPGKMASAGADWQTSAPTQIRWGLGYIKGRYVTPCGAWAHETSAGWY